VIKCALIGDPELLVLLERNGAEPVREIIQRAAKVKIDIVARDPLEKGIRAYLNLGHTFAHAFEVESRYQFSHGEAVAVGLVAAARLSALLGLCADNLASRIEAVLQQVELPVQYRQANPEALWKAMSADKKRMTGKIRFVLLEGIGKPKVVEDVPKTAIIEVLEGIVK
jgi:3-dehydroquinate synthetase